MTTISIATVEELVAASLEEHDGALADAIGNAASGADRLWDLDDARQSELDASAAILDEELAAIRPAIRATITAAMVKATARIAAELPDLPRR